jgi:hypothetical protein
VLYREACSARPWYQRLFFGNSAILVGITALGNASLISLRLAVICTPLILVGWASIQVIAHYWGIPWQTRENQVIIFRRLHMRYHLIILGVVALLWVPQVIPGLGSPDDKPPIKPVNDEVQERLLAGVIWDEGNEPLAGVEVSLPTYGKTMTTDTWGRFEFRVNALQETVTVMAKKAGYLMQTQEATLGNPELSVTMRKQP